MHLTTIKPKNSTEISSPNLKLYSKKKLEISRQYGTTLQTNKIKVKIIWTFIYEKRISTVYNLFSTIIQFSYLNEIE